LTYSPLQVSAHALNPGEGGLGAPFALLQSGKLRGDGGRPLLGLIAKVAALLHALPHRKDPILRCGMLQLQAADFVLLLFDDRLAGGAQLLVARALRHPVLQAAIQPRGLGLHLAEGRTLVGAFALHAAPLFAGFIGAPAQIFQQPREGARLDLRLFQLGLHLGQTPLRISQLALQGQRPSQARLAAGHSHVVKTFPGGREEKGVGILQREGSGLLRIRRDKTVAQLGQNRLQRAAETVQHADAVFQPHHSRHRALNLRCDSGEGELGLRVLGMNQKRRPAIDAALQQTHAFIGRVPAFHHNVVQLVAEKSIDNSFIFAGDLEEIGQGAHRGQSSAEGVRVEQLAHRIRGVAVLPDARLERVAPAGQRGDLGPQLVAPPLCLVFLTSPGLDLAA
jgi:hypothetical protein